MIEEWYKKLFRRKNMALVISLIIVMAILAALIFTVMKPKIEKEPIFEPVIRKEISKKDYEPARLRVERWYNKLQKSPYEEQRNLSRDDIKGLIKTGAIRRLATPEKVENWYQMLQKSEYPRARQMTRQDVKEILEKDGTVKLLRILKGVHLWENADEYGL